MTSLQHEDKTFQLKRFNLSSDGNFDVTKEVMDYFDEYGCVVVSALLPADESGKLREMLESPEAAERILNKRIENVHDGQGKTVRVTLWNNTDNGYPGVISACEKVAGTWEKLLGGEVYHYHTKLVLKDPKAESGGTFNWHQDYGYWYNNGCLRPDMGTTWLAVDKADRDNGCLKIVPRSHKLGRIDHINFAGKEVKADDERIEQVLTRFGGWVYVELNPGDAIFFHANILHRSDENVSQKRRWGFLTCYNTRENNPVKVHCHPRYQKLHQVPNSELKKEAKCPTDCAFLTSQGEIVH